MAIALLWQPPGLSVLADPGQTVEEIAWPVYVGEPAVYLRILTWTVVDQGSTGYTIESRSAVDRTGSWAAAAFQERVGYGPEGGASD